MKLRYWLTIVAGDITFALEQLLLVQYYAMPPATLQH